MDCDRLEKWKPKLETDLKIRDTKLKNAKDRIKVFKLIMDINAEELQEHKTALNTSAILTRALGRTFDTVIGIESNDMEIDIIKNHLNE